MRGGRRLIGAGVVLLGAGFLAARSNRAGARPQEAPQVELPPPEPPAPQPTQLEVPEVAPPARRRPPRSVVVLATVGVLAAGGYALARVLPGNDVSRPVLAVTPAPARQATSAAAAPVPTTAAPVTTAAPEATTAPSTTAQVTSAPATTVSGFVPARTFLWTPRTGATGYLVTLTRNGSIVLQRRTRDARLVLPSAFRFGAGRYRWTVWALPRTPGVGPQTDSSFVLSAAAAVAANRH